MSAEQIGALWLMTIVGILGAMLILVPMSDARPEVQRRAATLAAVWFCFWAGPGLITLWVRGVIG